MSTELFIFYKVVSSFRSKDPSMWNLQNLCPESGRDPAVKLEVKTGPLRLDKRTVVELVAN
jgi:hypothetical protein